MIPCGNSQTDSNHSIVLISISTKADDDFSAFHPPRQQNGNVMEFPQHH